MLNSNCSKRTLFNIKSDPRAALEPYTRLRHIVGSLKEAQPAAEGAAPHLINYADKLALASRQDLKRIFGDRLQKTLEDMKWPTRQLNSTGTLLDQWRQDVELLIDLQIPYVGQIVMDVTNFNGLANTSLGSCQLAMSWAMAPVPSRQFCSPWK